MGNHLAITENGKHKIGKRLFVTDENGKHRKGKKAFLTQNGKHRLIFSAGNDWAKYSCNYTPDRYYETAASGSDSGTYAGQNITLYSYYSFSESAGFTGSGDVTYHYNDVLGSAVGLLLIESNCVIELTKLTKTSGAGYFAWEGDIIAQCEMTPATYSKGSTPYGKLFADDGELPEAGTLVAGSVAEGHCVLKISGVYYYYEIV